MDKNILLAYQNVTLRKCIKHNELEVNISTKMKKWNYRLINLTKGKQNMVLLMLLLFVGFDVVVVDDRSKLRQEEGEEHAIVSLWKSCKWRLLFLDAFNGSSQFYILAGITALILSVYNFIHHRTCLRNVPCTFPDILGEHINPIIFNFRWKS